MSPSLERNCRCRGSGSDLVNISASWSLERTKVKEMRPDKCCWWTKWQFNSTCLVRSWNTGVGAIWIAARLSEWIGTRRGGGTDRSVSRQVSQVSSATTHLIDLYFAFTNHKEIEICFLDFQEIGAPPTLMKKPLIEWWVSLHKAQSALQNAWKQKKEKKRGISHDRETL